MRREIAVEILAWQRRFAGASFVTPIEGGHGLVSRDIPCSQEEA